MEIEIFGRTFYFLAEDKQWDKLERYLEDYLLNNKVTQIALLLSLLMILITIFAVGSREERKRIIYSICLLIWTAVLLLIFIFCKEPGTRGLLLVSLDYYLDGFGYHESRILISLFNMVMFLPFGLYLRKATGHRHFYWKNLLVILAAAFMIEALQFILARGYSSPLDIIAYLIGGILG